MLNPNRTPREGGCRPVATVLGINTLFEPELMVELEAPAVARSNPPAGGILSAGHQRRGEGTDLALEKVPTGGTRSFFSGVPRSVGVQWVQAPWLASSIEASSFAVRLGTTCPMGDGRSAVGHDQEEGVV